MKLKEGYDINVINDYNKFVTNKINYVSNKLNIDINKYKPAGANLGDISYSSNSINFLFKCMRLKDENMKIIDEYFSRFGYKINRIKKANLTGRPIFNFVEIGGDDVIGYGAVPSKYMEIINNACRKGITIWHNHSNIGNYNLDNK